MKILCYSLVFSFSLILFSGCGGKGNAKKDASNQNDTTSVPDTGYTGIKQYMSQRSIVKEVTFKNGVRQGLMKTFYISGRLRQTFWYENGVREDSSKWFYEEGQLFRTTPYKHDTIDGIQKQYYRNGKLKAKLGYSKGLRTLFFEEYTPEGKLVHGYPEIIVNQKDDYQAKGVYQISLGLSNKSEKVRFYRGDMSKGVFDTAHCTVIKTVKGIGQLNLKKTGSPKPGYVGVIAEILTSYGNNLVAYKKIDLPYTDLE